IGLELTSKYRVPAVVEALNSWIDTQTGTNGEMRTPHSPNSNRLKPMLSIPVLTMAELRSHAMEVMGGAERVREREQKRSADRKRSSNSAASAERSVETVMADVISTMHSLGSILVLQSTEFSADDSLVVLSAQWLA